MALVTSDKPLFQKPAYTSTFEKVGGDEEESVPSYFSCGYVPDGTRLKDDYLIKITSLRHRCTVIAVMQEPIQMKVESRWDPFIPSSMLYQGNIIAQMVTGSKTSLITKASSRRLWQGSTPLTISLNLKFEAFEDPYKEVTQPIKMLQIMALPRDPSGGKGLSTSDIFTAMGKVDISGTFEAISKAPLLAPPGPTPFTLDGILDLGDINSANEKASDAEWRKGLKKGDIIGIDWGKTLSFFNVIIKEVTPLFQPMFDVNHNPVSASVSIIFETYEMATVEDLKRSYKTGTGIRGM